MLPIFVTVPHNDGSKDILAVESKQSYKLAVAPVAKRRQQQQQQQQTGSNESRTNRMSTHRQEEIIPTTH